MATITDNDLALFRERAKTELKSTGDIGRLAWEDVVEALCKEVARLRSVSKKSGDNAKLRNALEVCLHAFQTTDWTTLGTSGRVVDLIQRCKSALAAPARNCDLARDWLHDLYVNFRPPASIKREMPPEWVDAVMEFCRWLVAPATKQEGENDGNK